MVPLVLRGVERAGEGQGMEGRRGDRQRRGWKGKERVKIARRGSIKVRKRGREKVGGSMGEAGGGRPGIVSEGGRTPER